MQVLPACRRRCRRCAVSFIRGRRCLSSRRACRMLPLQTSQACTSRQHLSAAPFQTPQLAARLHFNQHAKSDSALTGFSSPIAADADGTAGRNLLKMPQPLATPCTSAPACFPAHGWPDHAAAWRTSAVCSKGCVCSPATPAASIQQRHGRPPAACMLSSIMGSASATGCCPIAALRPEVGQACVLSGWHGHVGWRDTDSACSNTPVDDTVEAEDEM